MKKKLLKTSLFLVGAMFSLQAGALTLDEAVDRAGTSSHDLKQMKLQVESTRWSETKAMAGYLPKLDLSASHLFDEKFEELEIPFGGTNFVMPAIQPYSLISVTASYEIFSGFQTVNEVSAARQARDAAELRMARARQQIRSDIRVLFYKALGSQVLVDVANQNIATLEEHKKSVDSRVRAGISTRFDTLRVEVQLDEAHTEKYAGEANVVVNRARLFQAMGVEDDGTPLSGKLPESFEQYDMKKLAKASVDRSDRAAQVLEVEESLNLSKAALAHWYPKISLFGSEEFYNNYNASVWQSDERFKNAYSVGVMLKWNLFDGGAGLASQRQAAFTQGIEAEKLAKLDQAVPVDIETSKRRLSYDIINYKSKVSSIRKAEESVRLARGALRAGTLTNTEVLDAVLDLNRAKAAAVKSQIDAVEAIGQLELALGHSI